MPEACSTSPRNVYGLCTNAHTLDIQNGYERATNTVVPALVGADELSGIGELALVEAVMAEAGMGWRVTGSPGG